jgi:hypothetical protein
MRWLILALFLTGCELVESSTIPLHPTWLAYVASEIEVPITELKREDVERIIEREVELDIGVEAVPDNPEIPEFDPGWNILVPAGLAHATEVLKNVKVSSITTLPGIIGAGAVLLFGLTGVFVKRRRLKKLKEPRP